MPAYLTSQLIGFLFSIPCVLIAITFHEYAHGYVAYRLGDPTARNHGRLSLNPLKHLDPIGAICMLLFRFGWAKPVPINTRYFKKPRRDMALVSIAGPLTNLLLAFVGILLYRILYAVFAATSILNSMEFAWALLSFLQYFYMLNVSFAVFNMLPIPPFDGSRLIMLFLPPKVYYAIAKYERFIMLAVLVLLYLNILDLPLGWIVNLLINGMYKLVSLLPFL